MNVPEVKLATLGPGRPSFQERLLRYAKLIRLDRPIGILLLLWPTLWALWIAGDGQPPWRVVVIFILGVVLMRSAGCAINDFADRHIDGRVARTQARPVAAGMISAKEAVGVFTFLSLCAFALVLLLNWQTIALSVVAVVLAAVYPFMKRFTHLPQLVLGVAFGWAVPMAFTALHGQVPPLAWLLFSATAIWALIYDTEYAMVDREDDLKIGVKSTAILFGDSDRLVIGILQVIMLALLVVVGAVANLGVYYFFGVAAAGLAAVRQQFLIRKREPKNCFLAFQNNNCFGMAIFLGLFTDYILR